MKIYRAVLFATAGLLFLPFLTQLTLPAWYNLLIKIVATATAFYAAYHIRRSSLLDACGLLFMPFILMALMPNASPASAEPTAQFWLLLMAGNFIRMGVNHTFTPEVKQGKA
ncbi:hypothetical protein [Telluribacter sp. SYSU D00476]|uniref:hypothetical protein n=1 Tax=Telluribacter sp. SYSU D00476 TaxID=2811430 RepID=UPI001FF111A5|nr:hypothetical protein [Telluribacter sp. SYSU D00476]